MLIQSRYYPFPMASKKIAQLQNLAHKKHGKDEVSDSDSEIEDTNDDEVSNFQIKTKDTKQRTEELKFERLPLHIQIYKRPDMVIGSCRRIKSSGRIWVKDCDGFKCREAIYPEGLLRIFMEIACNVIDNIWRSKQFQIPAKFMRITIDRETGWFTVWNDGKPIPLTKFVEKDGTITDEYVLEVILGQCLSSSNYDDEEDDRKTSGRNGIGSKATNIFSTKFQVEAYNPTDGAIATKSWGPNMTASTPISFDRDKSHFPKKNNEGHLGYTKISWLPDYARFGMEGLDDDMMAVLEKSIYDYSLIARLNGVSTYYNEDLIEITDLKSYVKLYFPMPLEEMIQLKSDDCTVVLAPKADPLFKGDLMQVSFVNGILTIDGGVHVDAWDEAIFRPIVNKINKVRPEKKAAEKKAAKGKKKTAAKKANRPTIDITHVRKYFSIFLVTEVDKPDFKGQNKTFFNGPPVAVNVKPGDISKLMKWQFVQRIEESIRFREMSALVEAGKKKRGGHVRVKGLDDANNAGDKKLGQECILTVTEGDSAAQYVVNGMKYGIEGKIGHDWIGILPIRGKFLNVRKAKIGMITKNEEVKAVIGSLGLEYGLDYTILGNRNKLRYGKLYVIADGDYDGLHIIGLMYNFFATLFPSLLEADDFFHFLRIPIVKIDTRENQLSFLFQYAAQQYLIETKLSKKTIIRYFKGLGSSTKGDLKEDFGRYPVSLQLDEAGAELMGRVFDDEDEASDFRKDWLIRYEPKIKKRITPDYEIEEARVSDFLNEEMITYSLDSCHRAIASAIDGLKESHRKVLCAAFRKKINYKKAPLKVAQFAGYIAEHMGYHHGEMILYDTITKMAQRFPGSNNIPLFCDVGQFGTRRGGGPKLSIGKDAAKARYLHTKLEMLTRLIFRPEDDPYLPDRVDEGAIVEKEYYLPIVPMILVNGSMGIGTGSSSNVPQYNLLDIIDWIKIWLDKKGQIKEESGGVSFYDTPELVPFFRGFTGKVVVSADKITTYGVLEEKSKHTYRITEIPIGRRSTSILKFKARLEKMEDDKQIKKFKNNCEDGDKVDFTITTDDDGIVPTLSNLKLIDSISIRNMVLFDQQGKLHKFDSIEDLLCYVLPIRYQGYKIRKEGDLSGLRSDLKWVLNKIKFIHAVHNGTLEIRDRDEAELDDELDSKFDRKPVASRCKTKAIEHQDNDAVEDDVEDESEEPDEVNGKDEIDSRPIKNATFDYLLDMRARSLNIQSRVFKALEKERDNLQEKIVKLEAISIEKMWQTELDELKDTYTNKWLKVADCDSKGSNAKKGRFKPKKV